MLPHSLDTEAENDQQQTLCQEFTTTRGSPHTCFLIVMCRFMQIYERIVRDLPTLVACLFNEG